MRIMTINAGHFVLDHLVMHIRGKSALLVASPADGCPFLPKQRGIHRIMGEMAGKTGADRHRPMHVGALDEILVTFIAELIRRQQEKI